MPIGISRLRKPVLESRGPRFCRQFFGKQEIGWVGNSKAGLVRATITLQSVADIP